MQAAHQALALLNDKADGLRAEVAALREVQRGLSGGGARLVEVNERLVLAAVHADTVAQGAVKELREQVRQGQRDALTGTPNRALMLDRLQTAIAAGRRQEVRVAVLFLDLDQFKGINDTRGHAVGDEVLKYVARRLEAVVRDTDTVSRHSGDEFVVLLAKVAQASDAALIAAKLLASLALPSRDAPCPDGLSASIGIAIYPEDGDDATTLINRADEAMYRSKRRAPGRFDFYRSELGTGHAPEPATAPTDRATVEMTRERYARNLRDVNERLVIAAMTAQEVEGQVEATHRRQITFLATVAHELRNPLTPILQAAELIDRPATHDPRLARLQAVIKRQVTQMARLIDDLLDGARINTGKFRLVRRTVDLGTIVDTAVEAARPAIDRREQSLTIERPSAPIALHADDVRLVQVVTNLLDNASKYTPRRGTIRLVVGAVVEGRVTVTVFDDGIGITAEALPRIFDLFVQDAHAVEVDGGGLGIGLAVVRELVEGHGGTVAVTSDGKGCGSRFVVTLPVAA